MNIMRTCRRVLIVSMGVVAIDEVAPAHTPPKACTKTTSEVLGISFSEPSPYPNCLQNKIGQTTILKHFSFVVLNHHIWQINNCKLSTEKMILCSGANPIVLDPYSVTKYRLLY